MGPVGEIVRVSVNGSERTIHIKPNVFTDYTMTRLAALVKSRRRDERQSLIRELAAAGLTTEQMEAAMRPVIEDSRQTAIVGWETAVECLQSLDSDALAIVLMDCSEEIKSLDEAHLIIANHPNLMELVNIVFAVGQEAIEAAEKNSNPPSQRTKEMSAVSIGTK